MGIWEPLLEPLEDETRDGFKPWKLELKVCNVYIYIYTYTHVYGGRARSLKQPLIEDKLHDFSTTLRYCR